MPAEPNFLNYPQAEALVKIADLMQQGDRMLRTPADTWEALGARNDELGVWVGVCIEVLTRMFTHDTDANRFWSCHQTNSDSLESQFFEEAQSRQEYEIRQELLILRSVRERIPHIPQQPRQAPAAEVGLRHPDPKNGKVFLVHGHDTGLLAVVNAFVLKVGLKPIILHEQANKGATVIEKFEANADVAFAIVLLTADDVGAPKAEPDKLRPRARQNVLFELGYFVGRLGRDRVCAIADESLEVFSDFGGVVTLRSNNWTLEVARELKEAGLPIDGNRLI